jgi:hypothetical protein
MKSPLIDSNTNAVVVFDKGDIGFDGNATGWFMYVFKRSCRILVVNKNGIDAATVQLLLYRNDDSKEKLENLSATTYNLENGTVTAVNLNEGELYEENADKNYFYQKFSMPGVREGSIIEYSYSIKSNFIFNLPSWHFQSVGYPTLWSEFNVEIPGMLSYMTFFQGYHKYEIDKSVQGFKIYNLRSFRQGFFTDGDANEKIKVSSTTTIHKWVKKDLPSLKGENFIFSPKNFIDKISFQLNQTYDGESYHKVSNTWGKVTEDLRQQYFFGGDVKGENRWLDEILNPLIAENDNEDEIARKIYYYVQKNYTCTNPYNKYIETTLRDVVKKKSGSVGDINMLLIAMLNHKKIPAIPMLLSTRDFGRPPQNYPLLESFNYLIGKVNINLVDYYLDATTPFLPFGKLPLKCHNGYARGISEDSLVVLFEPDSLTETNSVNVYLSNTDKNILEGSCIKNMGFFETIDIKNTIGNSSLDKYKTSLKNTFPVEMLINSIEVDSAQSQEAPLVVKFDFSISSFQNDELIYFNPLIGRPVRKNPFYALKRLYPVEMPYKTDDIFTLNMEIPTGFKVDELPKSVRMNLNENEGMFEYLITADANVIQLRCRILLKKAIFSSEDYDALRDFYAFIVNKEAEQIVFKKIK